MFKRRKRTRQVKLAQRRKIAYQSRSCASRRRRTSRGPIGIRIDRIQERRSREELRLRHIGRTKGLEGRHASVDVDEMRSCVLEQQIEGELCDASLRFGAEDGVALCIHQLRPTSLGCNV